MKLRARAIGALSDAAQRDRTDGPERVVSTAELAKLLEEASAKVDALVRTLSEWDADYNSDGIVSKRDLRRVLVLYGIMAERPVVECAMSHHTPARTQSHTPARTQSHVHPPHH